MPRLFTGIEIPQTQRTLLTLAQSGLKSARWTEPSDMHITLRFIGDVSLSVANDVVDALSSRAWSAPQIQLGEFGVFGGEKPRSIYASIAEDEALINLQKAHETLMQRIGLPPDGRKFTPHVTVGRLRSGTDMTALAHYLSQRVAVASPPFQPNRFVLYSAKDSIGGGPYRIEESWDFQN